MTSEADTTRPPDEGETSPVDAPGLDLGTGDDADDRAAGDRAADQGAGEETGGILGEAVDVGERLAGFGQAVAHKVRSTAGEATRHILESQAARNRRLAALSRKPLPNLFELHPESRVAPVRDLGLQTIPVDEIRGTAVEGPAQRGRDFLPLPPFRSANWRERWGRIRSAQQGLSILPPIDVFQTEDGYWVIDGHNRVAAALYAGQPDIDAVVSRIRLPGEGAAEAVQGSMAAILAGNEELRAAAAGRLSPGSSLEGRVRDPMTYAPVQEPAADNTSSDDAEPEPEARLADDEPAP
jgi:hypothetical protein